MFLSTYSNSYIYGLKYGSGVLRIPSVLEVTVTRDSGARPKLTSTGRWQPVALAEER